MQRSSYFTGVKSSLLSRYSSFRLLGKHWPSKAKRYVQYHHWLKGQFQLIGLVQICHFCSSEGLFAILSIWQ